MTSTQSYVKLSGTPVRMRKAMRDINGRAAKVIRGNEGTVFICVPSSELGWVDKVAKDIGVTKTEVHELPEHGMAPCGVFTIDVARHSGRCKKCMGLRAAKRRGSKPTSGPVHTVAKVAGLKGLDMASLVEVLKSHEEEAMSLASEYDSIITAVEKLPSLESKLQNLKSEIEENRKAIKLFVSEVG